MKDGILKNVEVVVKEFRAYWAKVKDAGRRLSPPSLNPKNRESFVPHVLTGLLKDTIHELSRFWTYVIIVWGLVELIRKVV